MFLWRNLLLHVLSCSFLPQDFLHVPLKHLGQTATGNKTQALIAQFVSSVLHHCLSVHGTPLEVRRMYFLLTFHPHPLQLSLQLPVIQTCHSTPLNCFCIGQNYHYVWLVGCSWTKVLWKTFSQWRGERKQNPDRSLRSVPWAHHYLI